MRCVSLRTWASFALLLAAVSASAGSPAPGAMGPDPDGSLNDLQGKLDRLVGPGRLDARSDYIVARPGDPDPWFWVNQGAKVVALTLVERRSPQGQIGWYREAGGTPVIDGVDDGVVMDSWRSRGIPSVFRLPATVKHFGFYVEHTASGASGDGGSICHFTNHLLNDPGSYGGVTSAPLGGDKRMLVYNVSRWLGPDTWVVACEISDRGTREGNGEREGDHDYADIVFTVSAYGATPAKGTTFTGVKSRFR